MKPASTWTFCGTEPGKSGRRLSAGLYDLHCPHCFKPAFVNVIFPAGEPEITAGSYTLCPECFHTIVFDFDCLGMVLRRPEPGDKHAYVQECKILKAMKANPTPRQVNN